MLSPRVTEVLQERCTDVSDVGTGLIVVNLCIRRMAEVRGLVAANLRIASFSACVGFVDKPRRVAWDH